MKGRDDIDFIDIILGEFVNTLFTRAMPICRLKMLVEVPRQTKIQKMRKKGE